jgi:hypothetical protein
MVAVLTGFVVACLGPALIGLRTLLSVNELSGFYPWIALRGNQTVGHQLCSGDTIDAGLPGIAHARAQLFSGHLASWQNVVAGGGPLTGVPDLGLLDPLSLPYFILPLWLAPTFVVLLEFVVAIGGMFLFLRRLRVSRPASILAGIIFASSGFMVVWTNWPQTRVAALIPALFWAVERLMQRQRPADAVLVAVVVAAMLFGGFPQVTGFALYLVSGYVLVRVWMTYQGRLRAGVRAIALTVAGLVGGLLLTMVQLLPFLYFYQHADLGYRSGSAKVGLPFTGLITLIAPNAYGSCIGGQPQHGTTNPVELIAYIGSAAAVLAVAGAAFGFRRNQTIGRGVRGYFVAATAFIIFLVWISPTLRDAVADIPVFSGSLTDRLRSVLGFTLAVLAALGFDWLITARRKRVRSSRRPGPRQVWAVLIWSSVAVVAVVLLHQVRREALIARYWKDVEHATWIPVALVLVALSILVAARLRPQGGRLLAFLVVPVLVAGQGAQFFQAFLPGDSVRNFYPITPAHQFLKANLGSDRFASSGLTMYPATALYYGLRTPTGHAFVESGWRSLLTKVDPAVMRSPTFSDFSPSLNQKTIGNQPILDRMGVKYYVLPPYDLAGQVEPLAAADGAVDVGTGSATCTLPAQPLRGVTVQLARNLVGPTRNHQPTINAVVRDGNRTVSSGRYLDVGAAAGEQVVIPVAGEDLPRGGLMTVSLSATGAPGGLALATRNGSLDCAAVGPLDDGLKVVHADPGAVIYQRLTALPRIRWASRTVVLPDSSQRVTALAQGVPSDVVVLNAPGPAGSGQPGGVSVRTDNGDELAADVQSSGAGYLVVADAMQEAGWSVTLDGKKAKLVPADEAMVAVAVPAGTHRIDFRYRPPRQFAGLALSVVAALTMIAVLVWSVRRDRRERVATTRDTAGPRPPDLTAAEDDLAVEVSP